MRFKICAIAFLALLAISMTACKQPGTDAAASGYTATSSASPNGYPRAAAEEAQIEKLQVENEAKQLELNLQTQKIDRDLRLKIVNACIDKGDVPVIFGGNIGCQAPPKK